jgi:hypothetical protein
VAPPGSVCTRTKLPLPFAEITTELPLSRRSVSRRIGRTALRRGMARRRRAWRPSHCGAGEDADEVRCSLGQRVAHRAPAVGALLISASASRVRTPVRCAQFGVEGSGREARVGAGRRRGWGRRGPDQTAPELNAWRADGV